MATSREDDADSLSQITLLSTPRRLSWRNDDPMSDDDFCPYTPPLGQRLTFTPTSTPQKSAGDSSTDEESLSESEFEANGGSFRRRLTFSGHDPDESPSAKGITR